MTRRREEATDDDNGRMRTRREAMVPEDEAVCDACGLTGKELGRLYRCSMCSEAVYCGKTCQARDWGRHRLTCAGVSAKKKARKWTRAMDETRTFVVEKPRDPIDRPDWFKAALESSRTDPSAGMGEFLEGLGCDPGFMEFFFETKTELMLLRLATARKIGKDLVKFDDDLVMFEKMEDAGLLHFIHPDGLDAVSDAGLRRLLEREAMECLSNERRVLLAAARRAVAQRVARAFAASADLPEFSQDHPDGGAPPLDVVEFILNAFADSDKVVPYWLLGVALDIVPPSKVFDLGRGQDDDDDASSGFGETPQSTPMKSTPMKSTPMTSSPRKGDVLPATVWRPAMRVLGKIGTAARFEDANVKYAMHALERAKDLADEIDRDVSMDLATTEIRRDLAEVYRFVGRLDDAIRLDRRVVAALDRAGADDRTKATAYFKLADSITGKARMRLAMGFPPMNLPEARELYDKAIAIYDLLDPDHIDRADILHGLAHVMYLQDPTGKADSEAMGRKALRISRWQRGHKHPKTQEMYMDWDPNNETDPFGKAEDKAKEKKSSGDIEVVHIPPEDDDDAENKIPDISNLPDNLPDNIEIKPHPHIKKLPVVYHSNDN